MDEKEAEARPVMGTIFLVFVCTIRGLRYQKQNRMEEETEPQT